MTLEPVLTTLLLLLLACTGGSEPVSDGPPEPTGATEVVGIEDPGGATASEADLPRDKATAEVDASKLGVLPDGVGVAPGQVAPDALLADFDGRPVQLSELYADGPVMLVFYRGGWCPFCNFQVRELVDGRRSFADRGVRPVLVSVDKPDEASRTRNAWHVPYPLLSDPDLAAHEAFHVVHEVDPQTVEKLKSRGMDIEAHSGRNHHKIAVPAIFLIVDGEVKWAHADPEYKVRPSNQQLYQVIDATLGGA